MIRLELEFPQVTFVYMTGHLDGTGEDGNLHQRNNQIREFCRINNKVLFDCADINRNSLIDSTDLQEKQKQVSQTVQEWMESCGFQKKSRIKR